MKGLRKLFWAMMESCASIQAKVIAAKALQSWIDELTPDSLAANSYKAYGAHPVRLPCFRFTIGVVQPLVTLAIQIGQAQR